MGHPCFYSGCLDNVRGECFAGGCDRNPSREEIEDYLTDCGDAADEEDETDNGETENEIQDN